MDSNAGVVTWPWQKAGWILLISSVSMLVVGLLVDWRVFSDTAVVVGSVGVVHGLMLPFRKSNVRLAVSHLRFYGFMALVGLVLLLYSFAAEPESDWCMFVGVTLIGSASAMMTQSTEERRTEADS